MTIIELKKSMLDCAKNLTDNGVKASPSLRTIQENLRAFQPTDPNMRFFCFFLFNFIEDVFYNLTGDFPYHRETYELRKRIFTEIGEGIQKLAEQLESPNWEFFHKAYVEIVNSYLNRIAEMEGYLRGN